MNLMFMFTTMANIQYFAKLWHLQFMGSSRRPVSIIVYTILYQAAKPELSGYTRTSKFGCCLLRKLHKTTHPAIIDSLIDSRVLTILYFTVVSLLSALCDVVSWLVVSNCWILSWQGHSSKARNGHWTSSLWNWIIYSSPGISKSSFWCHSSYFGEWIHFIISISRWASARVVTSYLVFHCVSYFLVTSQIRIITLPCRFYSLLFNFCLCIENKGSHRVLSSIFYRISCRNYFWSNPLAYQYEYLHWVLVREKLEIEGNKSRLTH